MDWWVAASAVGGILILFDVGHELRSSRKATENMWRILDMHLTQLNANCCRIVDEVVTISRAMDAEVKAAEVRARDQQRRHDELIRG